MMTQNQQPSLREKLYALFQIDLPIQEGSGEDLCSAIKIEYTGPAMFVAVQYEVLELIFRERDLEWEVHEQRLHRENGRIYDVVQVIVLKDNDEHYPQLIENYHFDITDCIEKDLTEDSPI